MTKEDEDDRHDTRVAALLAVHLVSQVLDEAYVIANAATESGEPWLYISMLKDLRDNESYSIENDNISFLPTKGDSDVNQNKMDVVANVIATSTPQKITGDKTETESFIGQGDEEMDLEQGHLTKSTSVFINNLFDMSEVEHVIFCDDNPMAKKTAESNELLTQTMTKIMESYINTALGIAFEQHPVNYGVQESPSPSTDYSDYSFLMDAIPSDLAKDIGFSIHEDITCQNNPYGDVAELTKTDTDAEVSLKTSEKYDDDNIKQKEVAFYENTYLTLNRDEEQCSDDGDPILQDPKELALQEIELMTAHTSENNLCQCLEQIEKPKEETVTPTVVETAGSRKGNLVRRCRDQGAKFLARIRGWWRRKTPGKHKEPRVSTLITGMCPLSPDARRRAASLLDQRVLRSPSPSRAAIWKFNTVNEALVNSSRWKEYTFDPTAND